MLPPPPPPPMPASPTLLLMVGFGVVCRPSPTALSAVRFYQPPPSCDRRRFRRRAAFPFCLPSPATVLSLFYRASIAFAAPVDGWLLHSPPTQQHTDHITSPSRKCFQFPPSWTYFDLLRVSMCLVPERLKNLRGCKLGSKHSRFSYLRML